MKFIGKVALVTGAGSGIGEEVSVSFAKLGAEIALLDLNASGLAAVAEKIRGHRSPESLAIVADVIVRVTVRGLLRKRFRTSADWIDNAPRIAALWSTKLAAPPLEKTRGNIVNVASLVVVGQRQI